MEQSNWWIFAGAVISGFAVIIGAFGSHGLEGKISADRLNTFEIGVRYQMYHGLALLALSHIQSLLDTNLLNYVGIGFIVGTIVFSGSLYLLVLTNTSWLGAITPIGGIILIVSWVLLAYSALV